MLVQPFNDLRLQCFGNLSPDLFWYRSKLFPLRIVTPFRKVKNYQALTARTILVSEDPACYYNSKADFK